MMAAGNGWNSTRHINLLGRKPTPKMMALQVAHIMRRPCQIGNALVLAANREGSHITAPAVTKANIRIRALIGPFPNS